MGTGGGLSRFESSSNDFVNYGTAASGTPLSDLRVRAIREDHGGALWIGTYRGGLDRLEPDTGHLTVFRHDERMLIP